MHVNPVIVTSLNSGYIPLLRNLRYSLQQIGLLENLTIFSYGDRCYKRLLESGIQSILIEQDKCIDSAVSFEKRDWKYITYQKIKTIELALKMFDGFLYVDPDVVFQRNTFPFFKTLPEGFDIYGQTENVTEHILCTGFMYIKRTPSNQQLFSISWDLYQAETGLGDQRYVNKNREKMKFYLLPAELFLGGVWFCSRPGFMVNSEILANAYIAHYNFTSCMLEKYIRMKKNGHVFVYPLPAEQIPIVIKGLIIFTERRIKNLFRKYFRRILRKCDAFKSKVLDLFCYF